ncbi:MAG TPA: winged helix-turn-helix domain-containing protein [Terriglobales bacterium]|nr:winged helix-turn-helix domain-containing protein [Terriglobales bacterium]
MDCDFQIGEWVIFPRLNSLSRNGDQLRIEPKVMQVLLCLAEARDVVSKEKLMRTVWADTFVSDDVLTRSISELRKIFGDSSKSPRYIQTIPKGGYRLMLPVEAVRTRQTYPPHVAQVAGFKLKNGRRFLLPWITVALLAMLLIAYAVGRYNSSIHANSGSQVLAVLPFQNLNEDPQQDFFADGLTAEMISQLGRVSSDRLGVIAWASMIRYKHTGKSQDQIAQELGATYLLDGTVRRWGNHVRITAELEEIGRRSHVWSNTYDGTMQDVVSLQSQFAREIAQEIRLQLTPRADERLASKIQLDGNGYEFYLRAKSEPESMLRGAEDKANHLREAIRLNPKYAPPYVALAMSYRSLASRGFADPKASYEASRSILARAVELDPNSSDVHRELGWINWRYDWNFAEADREFRHAIDLNPNDSQSREVYSLFLKGMGRYQEALAQSNRVIELNPMAAYSRANAGSLLAMMNRFELAMLEFEQAVKIDPREPYVWERMGPVLLMQGKKQEAIDALKKASDYSDGQQDKIGWLGYAYAVSGREQEARQVLVRLRELESQHQYVSPLHVALIYEGLKDHERALASLEKAFAGRDEYLVYLNIYPEFSGLRSDPRFRSLLGRIGFFD